MAERTQEDFSHYTPGEFEKHTKTNQKGGKKAVNIQSLPLFLIKEQIELGCSAGQIQSNNKADR